MQRECTRCSRPFAPQDLSRDDSRGMERERKAAGLEGVRFLYYHCPSCGTDDIFVDVLPLDGESAQDFQRRREELEAVVRRLHAEGRPGSVEAVVVAVGSP